MLLHTCLAKHVDVDPGRNKVGEPSSHDHNAPALEQGPGVEGCPLLEGFQLSLSTFDSLPANKTQITSSAA